MPFSLSILCIMRSVMFNFIGLLKGKSVTMFSVPFPASSFEGGSASKSGGGTHISSRSLFWVLSELFLCSSMWKHAKFYKCSHKNASICIFLTVVVSFLFPNLWFILWRRHFWIFKFQLSFGQSTFLYFSKIFQCVFHTVLISLQLQKNASSFLQTTHS